MDSHALQRVHEDVAQGRVFPRAVIGLICELLGGWLAHKIPLPFLGLAEARSHSCFRWASGRDVAHATI